MAEITVNSHARGRKGKLRRAKKLSTRVDLTPMVDLGFLLITFFMVTTTWSKPKAMNFDLLADGPPTSAGESLSLTIIPLEPGKFFYYHGSLEEAMQNHQYDTCNYSFENGIGDVIRKKQIALDKNKKFKGGRKEMVVMIKPADTSDMKNVVKVFDEMLINQV